VLFAGAPRGSRRSNRRPSSGVGPAGISPLDRMHRQLTVTGQHEDHEDTKVTKIAFLGLSVIDADFAGEVESTRQCSDHIFVFFVPSWSSC
jgi:hypothetical protein